MMQGYRFSANVAGCCLQTTFTCRGANLGSNICKYDKAC